MSRRIDIELTSTRPDGSWTWRAAGAKQPKGDVDSSLLPASAKVGDVMRADIDMFLDGMSVTAILPPKGARTEPDRIEIVGTGRDAPLVTSTLVERRGRRDSGDRGDQRPRGDRPDRGGRSGGPGGDRGRGGRPGGDRPGGERSGGPGGDRRPRGDRPDGGSGRPRRERPDVPAAPKPARLRAGRTHRNAVLAELPPEQTPIAEQLLKGGVPAVRQAIDKQNAAAKAEGQPEINADGLLAFAEQLLPRLRAAEWRDKAEAALAGMDELDLRDLRTVVVAADTAARDEPTKALAQQLRDGLTARVDSEHAKWLAELTGLVNEGRTVRALRLSSRPPKTGAPLPAELAERLAAAAGEGLTAEITQDRWGTMVDAIAFSPVRLSVQPVGVPKEVGDELKATMGRVGSRIPQIAEKLGITVEAAPRARPSGKGKRPAGGARPVPPPPPKPAAVAPATADDVPTTGDAPESEAAPATESPAPESAASEAVVPETDTTEAPAAEAEAPEASSDGAQDAVVVEELSETVDEA